MLKAQAAMGELSPERKLDWSRELERADLERGGVGVALFGGAAGGAVQARKRIRASSSNLG